MRLKFALTLGVAAMVTAAACGGGQPETAPQPDPDSIAAEQARRDSIAAEQARRDSIERARRLEEERIRREREEAARREREITAAVAAMVATVINFDFDRSNIRPGTDMEVLEQKLAVLQANPALMIEITGHCDERGSDEYNMALGMRRALSAKKWLTDRGIDGERITVRSMGEEMPVDPRSNEEAWAQNRRDEFAITGGGDKLVQPSGM
jgi:peptidoglycan-associated lipoprotein